MSKSKIEWTDESWPVVTGCSPVSKGCQFCWAAKLAAGRLRHHRHYEGLALAGDPPRWTGDVRVNFDVMTEPLKWRKARKAFVAPTGDLFHHQVPTGVIWEVFQTMRAAPLHTFQVLTKRAERMAGFVEAWLSAHPALPNVWLGASVEDHKTVGRVDHLRAIEWPIKWVSLEPLLGPMAATSLKGLNWIVIGGESGKDARPMHPRWVTMITDYWGGLIPIFFKQWGEWLPWGDGDYTRAWLDLDGTVSPFEGPPPAPSSVMATRVGKKKAGALVNNREWREYPMCDEVMP